MSNHIKSMVSSLVLGLVVLSAPQVFADTRPTFEIQTPKVFEGGIVQFIAEYDSQENNYHPVEQPVTWFEFGTDANNLEYDTPRRVRLKGEYEVTQGVSQLQPETIYYVRAVIKFEGEATQSNIVSFNSNILTPVILNNYADVPTTALYNPQQGATQSAVQNNTTGLSSNPTAKKSTTVAPSGNYITGNPPTLSMNLLNFPNIFSFHSQNNKLLDTSSDKRELITYAERSNFDNSATNDNSSGEIIGTVKDKKYAGTNTSLSASVNMAGKSLTSVGARTNYGALLLILVMLAIIVFLARLTLYKRRRVTNKYGRVRPYFSQKRPAQQLRRPQYYQPQYNR